METKTAVKALAALAQDTRLSIFRALVQAGAPGLAAGVLAECLNVPNATLSFHLKELFNAGLITARQESRFIYYAADFAAMNALLAFMTENCCAGDRGRHDAACCPTERRKSTRQTSSKRKEKTHDPIPRTSRSRSTRR
jgi:DNA-binding transcriptional ArsR family regulator